ncbi:ribonuclease H-like domain-containing protein [Plantactinospora solaniradicis]|uniref:Ribonuclease H-like domain-containing protein n=1 Tax=Plantactinospora solaniradicis TaxID=1723736 RepID=A0ABW1KKW1_9ACTN
MLVQSGYMLCFSTKWLREPEVEFFSIRDHGAEGMARAAWDRLNAADAVVHYNGRDFDIPTLNQEMFTQGLPPPSPYRQIDLMRVAKKQFRLPSNKLQYVSNNLLQLGGKEEHSGFRMWLGVMNNDPEAWAEMEKYNRRDVVVLEDVFGEMLPWIPNFPNISLYDDTPGCPRCGSEDLRKEGHAYTSVSKYQRYQCKHCGAWSRGNKRLGGVDRSGL